MEIKMELLYRQTLNLVSKRWVIPKRRAGLNTWTPVRNIRAVVSPKYGFAGAIRRMQKVFDKKRNPNGSKMWETEVQTVYLPKNTNPSKYAVTYLKCRRTSYGFSRSL